MAFSKLALLAALSVIAHADFLPANIPVCTDGLCNDCPVTFVDTLGYPQCAVYGTSGTLTDGTYEPAENGGVMAFFNIGEQDEGCATIIRSPAGTQEIDCGQNLGTFYNPTCALINLQSTFMVQFCCGTDDCNGAGAGLPTRSIRGTNQLGKRSGSGAMVLEINGTRIEPLEVGSPINTASFQKRNLNKRNLNKRDCVYTESSTTTVPGDTRVVAGPVTGPQDFMVSSEVSVSMTSSFNVGITSEIFSAGASFETTNEESSTLASTFPVPDGQTGFVVWTPFLKCTVGTVQGCSDDGEADGTEGRACYPVKDGDDQIVGNYAFQIRS